MKKERSFFIRERWSLAEDRSHFEKDRSTFIKDRSHFKKERSGFAEDRQSRRQGEETWADMGICVRRPFRDTRDVKVPGQAEWREYRARYWNNEPIGDWSNVVRVTVNP